MPGPLLIVSCADTFRSTSLCLSYVNDSLVVDNLKISLCEPYLCLLYPSPVEALMMPTGNLMMHPLHYSMTTARVLDWSGQAAVNLLTPLNLPYQPYCLERKGFNLKIICEPVNGMKSSP